MLDHAFLQVVEGLRRSMADALLEREADGERLHVDVLLGDVSWEAAYTLPGEDRPPRVQAEVSLEWSPWSQAAYRAWSAGEALEDPAEVDVDVALRLQRMAGSPQPELVLSAVPDQGPVMSEEALERSGPTIEHHHDEGGVAFAAEVSYSGVLRLDESVLGDGSRLDGELRGLGRWVASTLVHLADLDLAFLPPELEEDGPR